MYSKKWERNDPRQRASDILKAIGRIHRYVKDISLDDFINDEMRQDAIIRALLVVSEAARNLPEDLLMRHPQIEWRDIKGLGNVYRHDYGKLDEATIWNTATDRALIDLENALQEEMNDFGE